MKKFTLTLSVLLALVVFSRKTYAHCEIPCGIYDDEMRIELITEHITTVEKSIKMIITLSEEPDKNHNQLVRWIMNKEEHAKSIQEIVYQYFMTQRIKPANEKNTEAYQQYIKQLTLLHQMLTYAMKAKQTTDLSHIEKLRSLLDEFKKSYFDTDHKY
jgi:nickel superoxide dismutase